MFESCCAMLVVRCLLCGVCCLLLIVVCSRLLGVVLRVVRCSLFVVCCLLSFMFSRMWFGGYCALFCSCWWLCAVCWSLICLLFVVC